MKPIKTFVLHNSFKAMLAAERGLKKLSGGRLCQNLFDVPAEYVGSSVKILRETQDEVFIAKLDSKGRTDDGKFKILVATDLHLSGEPWRINKALTMLARHVRAVKPDLILFTGDVIQTEFQQVDCIQFGQFMEKMGVYWAYVFGNHEAREEKEYHKYFMLKNLTSFPLCLSKFGDPQLFGYGNFAINIMNSDSSIKQSIFMLDSGRSITDDHRAAHGVPTEIEGYDFLKSGQINWYRNKVESLRSVHGDFKSLMLMHIPLCEFEELYSSDDSGQYVPTGNGEILYGRMLESVGCSQFNSGMFDAVTELGSTQAVFAGHDHINDFCALYKGVYLTYAQCGGYDDYITSTMTSLFGEDEKNWMQGVTVVEIQADSNVKISQRFNTEYVR